MSLDLVWRPVVQEKKVLPDELRHLLTTRGWLNLGSSPMSIPTTDETAICYLQGLRDADVPGATELLAAIERYKEVEIWLE